MTYSKNDKLHIVAVVAVIRRDGKYLILKRRDDETAFPGIYTLPGGKVERNESMEDALIKEIKEETGLILRPGKILLKDATFLRPDNQSVKVFSYLCEAEGEVEISNDFTDYKWISPEELDSISHVGIKEDISKSEEILESGINLDLFKTKSERK